MFDKVDDIDIYIRFSKYNKIATDSYKEYLKAVHVILIVHRMATKLQILDCLEKTEILFST